MDAERREEIEQELREEQARIDAEGNRRERCPACGRGKKDFITTTPIEASWSIECKCGYLIDED